jgi:hypothetical protein
MAALLVAARWGTAVRDYSFRFLDQLGRSQPTEHMRFMDDQAATDFARNALQRSAVVEVWRGKDCVIRVEHPSTQPAPPPITIATPIVDAASPKGADPRIIAIHGYDRPTK